MMKRTPKKSNPYARVLRSPDGQYRKRVVASKKHYTRKVKHPGRL